MFRVFLSAFVIASVSAQFGGIGGYGGYGGHQGGYGAFGQNAGSGIGSYGGGAHGGLSQGTSGYHGLGRGAVHQGTHGQIIGGTAVGGYGNANGVQKHFNDHTGLQDHLNTGHNRVFAKEKVYSVDQAYGSGGKAAFGATHGNFGGYGQGGAYHTSDHLAKNHAGGYGAHHGYGNGAYNNHVDQGFGNHGYGHHGAQQLNNYGSFGGGQGQHGHHGHGAQSVGLPYGGYGVGQGIGSPYLYSGGLPYHG